MRIVIGGALGRMGQELASAAQAQGIQVACGVDVAYAGQPADFPMVAGYERVTQQADVLIDFSRPDALPEILAFCRSRRLPAVLCTTGYTDVELASIHKASQEIPLLRSANMSLGVHVLEQMMALACKVLGEGYDIEIVERHHRMKADSPSGTALMLYDTARREMGGGIKPVYGRYGRMEQRQPGDVGIHAVRGGSMTGEHEVGFYGEGEQLLLIHRAENRSLFAQGALKAGRFLAGKPAGLYSMRDVVAQMLA
ncbi:MAG: 4-hydroxy-tetrahydrodipicolinate reductase [Clostridiales bacterium]|nr:4-hydroxy-tetrahydrodipicolinate reductase [Clostridiales bacterium]